MRTAIRYMTAAEAARERSRIEGLLGGQQRQLGALDARQEALQAKADAALARIAEIGHRLDALGQDDDAVAEVEALLAEQREVARQYELADRGIGWLHVERRDIERQAPALHRRLAEIGHRQHKLQAAA